MSEEKVKDNNESKNQCFVIMPIGDKEGYSKGHFKRVYEDILGPAITDAGFIPYRADDGGGSQNIQIDIIQKIIESPMAICDLSTRNPNVLFELGVRQAFDKPVALIEEEGTPRIFDINTFNTFQYRSKRIYDEVIEDRKQIAELVKETYRKHNEGDGVNSIIRLIPSMKKADIGKREVNTDQLIKIMYGQMTSLSNEIYQLKNKFNDLNSDEICITMPGNAKNEKLKNRIIHKLGIIEEKFDDCIRKKASMSFDKYHSIMENLYMELEYTIKNDELYYIIQSNIGISHRYNRLLHDLREEMKAID